MSRLTQLKKSAANYAASVRGHSVLTPWVKSGQHRAYCQCKACSRTLVVENFTTFRAITGNAMFEDCK